MSGFSLNDVMWRHVTSPGQIFTKISENVPFIYILSVTKYKVNWIISLKVMDNVFFSSNMEIYRKMLFLPQNQPKYDIWEGITSEPLVIGRWLTPHLKALCELFTTQYVWLPYLLPFLLTSAIFLPVWAKNPENTSRDVTWRHHIGFSPNFQKMFYYFLYY